MDDDTKRADIERAEPKRAELKRPKGQADDGVRIVDRDEARAAIESGEVITRGSVPQSPPITSLAVGPSQATLSFPLAEDDSSQIVVRPRLAARPVSSIDQNGAEVLDLRAAEREARFESDGEEETASITNLPHWTEPPTGEVMVGFPDRDDDASSARPRWRDEHSNWDDNDVSFDDLGVASGLGTSASEDGFDASSLSGNAGSDEKSWAAGDAAVDSNESSETKHGKRPREESVIETAKNKLGTVSFARRVATASVVAAVALVAFLLGPVATLILAGAAMLLAAVEYFDAMRRSGYRPATILGLVGIAGLVFGAYVRGEAAIVLVLALTAVFTFLWYLSGVIRANPTANVASTLLGVVWLGVLGAFASLLLRMSDRHGMAFVLGAVLCTIVYDSVAYIGGNVLGRTPLARDISPNKTWEGLFAGTVASVVVGGLVGSVMHPWSLATGLALGALVAVVSPLGDLVESMVKRDLGLKDMGHLLPGHGGVLDRFDALLFVLPATYYLVVGLNIG